MDQLIQNQKVQIKCEFRRQIFSFSINFPAKYEDLLQIINSTPGIRWNRHKFILKYLDDESDEISIDSTMELNEAIKVTQQLKLSVLRIFIKKRKKLPGIKIEPIYSDQKPILQKPIQKKKTSS
eukprot:Anaeramoba_ignava/a608687_12.p1 GENE.a608687_12~~a608687_12.p1  ORF type:complete len:124 (+),score=32.31 a608687_12:14-385(+)